MVLLQRRDPSNADAIVVHYCSNDLSEMGEYCLHGGRLDKVLRQLFGTTLSLANASYACLVSLPALL